MPMTPGGHPLQPDYEFNLPGTNGLVLRIVAEEPGLSIAAVYDANNQKISPRLADLQIFNMKIPTMPRENKPTESHIMLLNLIHNYRVTLRGQTFLDLTRAYHVEEHSV